jgi:hypothetical protein
MKVNEAKKTKPGPVGEERTKRIIVLISTDEFEKLKAKTGLVPVSTYVRDLILKNL